jgi:diguanylate cyclase (GGDEF)-like protein
VHVSSVVAAFALGCGLVAGAGAVVLTGTARRHGGAGGNGPRWLAVGAALAAVTLVLGLAGTAVLPGGWGPHGQRMLLANLVGAGTAVTAVAFCAGLLRLPGAAGSAALALRYATDAVVVAAGLWFVGWVLLSEPTRLLGTGTPSGCPAVLVATVTTAVTAGFATIVTVRSTRPRRHLVLPGLAATAVAVGGLGLAAGICQTGPRTALAGALLMAAGVLALALSTRSVPGAGPADAEVIRRGTAYAVVPMLAMAVSAVYHLLRDGAFTLPGIVAGIVEGFALVARQSVALRDVRGYAGRLAEREAHFRELAHTDPLTGLANRRGLLRALHEDAAGAAWVLLGLDLDGFKNVNDVRGHDVGDAVLVEVGRRVRGNLRPGDVAARLGGDEFAVLLRADIDEAHRIAERLLDVLGRPYEQPEGRVFLSVSIGVADRSAAADVEALLRNADLALRSAKQRGKNRIERYDATYDSVERRRRTVEHELRGAVRRGELRLVFQPVVAVPSVRPVGAEALLRWTHPVLGAVRPDEFIPLAEECGMIAELGAWVLNEACRQLSRWLAAGHDVWASVNVSPRELHAPEYVVQVAEALRAYRVPPQRLVLEVTEHAVAEDVDELIRRLSALRLTGVRIALDDFGAGYSSLGQLRRLPIDILKIDHSLVAGQETVRPDDGQGRPFAPMVDVVMRLGHQLGLEVIAEGVTNQTELAAVVAAGCRFGQGHLFGWGCRPSTWRRCWTRPPRIRVPGAACRSGRTPVGRSRWGRAPVGRCRLRVPRARGRAPPRPFTMWDQLTHRVRCGRLKAMSPQRAFRVLT